MRTLVFDPNKKCNQNPGHQYTFYEVLQVLHYFIDEESKFDKGKTLKEMNRIRSTIIQLAVDLKKLALTDNWYDVKKINHRKLKILLKKRQSIG